mgnify:CR=1 FL=1
MNKLLLKRNYKYILFFIFLILVSIIFSETRIISYNFWKYTTEIKLSDNNIDNSIDIWNDEMIHNIKLNLTKEDYKNLVLYYKSNEEKQYIKTDIEIDWVIINDIWLKLKWSNIIIWDLEDVNTSEIDFSFTIKFDEYITDMTYLGRSEIALISWTIDELKWEYIAWEIYENFWIKSPDSSFVYLEWTDFINKYYLVKEIVDEAFLAEEFNDSNGLLYKWENSLSFTYLWEDPTAYTDLFTQKTLKNNYDLKKMISVLEFVSNSWNDNFKYQLSKYINIENYTKFLAINNFLYWEKSKLKLLNSYYIYYDLSTETIKFIPWDSQYPNNIEDTSVYQVLEKIYSKQEIAELWKKDIREILWNITGTIPDNLKSKYSNDLEDKFLKENNFEDLYNEVEEQIIDELESTNFIENVDSRIENLFYNN